MTKKKTTLDKIEQDLLPEAEGAAGRGNTQRAIAALLESLKHLVQHAREANMAIDEVKSASEPVDETDADEKKNSKPAKKTPVKKTGGEPTPDMLKSPDTEE